jgi:hypothetical protein
MTYETFFFPSLVTDGDMETSGTSNWTDSGATSTKDTTAANVYFGTQSLKVANASASDYTASDAVNVYPDTTYVVQAWVRVASGTARLQAYDSTNSAAIDAITGDERAWQRLYLVFSTPSTCKQVVIRLVGDEATAECYWNLVTLYETAQNRLLLPSYITHRQQVRKVQQMVELGAAVSSGQYAVQRPYYTNITGWDIEGDPTAAGGLALVLPYSVDSSWVPVVLAQRTYSSLATDSATTNAPDDWVEAESILEIYKLKAAQTPAAEIDKWQNLLLRQGRTCQGLRRLYVPHVPEQLTPPR